MVVKSEYERPISLWELISTMGSCELYGICPHQYSYSSLHKPCKLAEKSTLHQREGG